MIFFTLILSMTLSTPVIADPPPEWYKYDQHYGAPSAERSQYLLDDHFPIYPKKLPEIFTYLQTQSNEIFEHSKRTTIAGRLREPFEAEPEVGIIKVRDKKSSSKVDDDDESSHQFLVLCIASPKHLDKIVIRIRRNAKAPDGPFGPANLTLADLSDIDFALITCTSGRVTSSVEEIFLKTLAEIVIDRGFHDPVSTLLVRLNRVYYQIVGRYKTEPSAAHVARLLNKSNPSYLLNVVPPPKVDLVPVRYRDRIFGRVQEDFQMNYYFEKLVRYFADRVAEFDVGMMKEKIMNLRLGKKDEL